MRCVRMQADGTEKKMGAYLMKTCFQTSTISSAMFITAMAANPLAVDLAKDALGQTISWGQWALAGAHHANCLATDHGSIRHRKLVAFSAAHVHH